MISTSSSNEDQSKGEKNEKVNVAFEIFLIKILNVFAYQIFYFYFQACSFIDLQASDDSDANDDLSGYSTEGSATKEIPKRKRSRILSNCSDDNDGWPKQNVTTTY